MDTVEQSSKPIYVHDYFRWAFYNNMNETKKFPRHCASCDNMKDNHRHYPVYIYEYVPGINVPDTNGSRREFRVPSGFVLKQTIPADCYYLYH